MAINQNGIFFQDSQQVSLGINWVNGLKGANDVNLPWRDSCAVLFDETRNVMYIKSTDNIGRPSMKTYAFEEIQEDPNATPYLTKEEFFGFMEKFKGEMMSYGTNTVSANEIRNDGGGAAVQNNSSGSGNFSRNGKKQYTNKHEGTSTES